MLKDKFLLNKEHKQQFLRHLTAYMVSYGMEAVQAYADTDVQIATTAVSRNSDANVIVIGKDIYLLILLLHHYVQSRHSLIFTSAGENNLKSKKAYNIGCMREMLPQLSLNVFLGCDTVSRVYSIGKGTESLKKILKNEKMQLCVREFNVLSADKSVIAKVGEGLLCQFYEKDVDVPLNTLRYRMFQKKVAVATTAVAAMLHSYSNYLQTQVWKGEPINR